MDAKKLKKYLTSYIGSTVGLLFALLLIVDTATAQVQVKNVSSEWQDQELVVTYDLRGELDEEYQVALLISTSQGQDLDYRPEAVQGAVGDNVSVGTGKQIVWDVRQDVPAGLENEEVRFRVVAEGQGRNALWYVPNRLGGGWGIRGSWERGFQVRRGEIEQVSGVNWWQAKLGYTGGRFVLRGIYERTDVTNEMQSVGPELGIQLFGKQDGSPLSLNVNGKYVYTWGQNGSFSQHEYRIWGRLYHPLSLGSSVELVPSIRYDPLRARNSGEIFDSAERTVQSFPRWGWTGLGLTVGSSSFGLHFSAQVPVWVGEFDTVSFGWEAPVLSGGIYF